MWIYLLKDAIQKHFYKERNKNHQINKFLLALLERILNILQKDKANWNYKIKSQP